MVQMNLTNTLTELIKLNNLMVNIDGREQVLHLKFRETDYLGIW